MFNMYNQGFWFFRKKSRIMGVASILTGLSPWFSLSEFGVVEGQSWSIPLIR